VARYLIIRLSAMGDVAMLIPLLYAVARANEQHEFILLTQPFFTELLLDAPDNVEGMAIDIRRGEERSFLGLLRYARRLRHEHFDAVLDLRAALPGDHQVRLAIQERVAQPGREDPHPAELTQGRAVAVAVRAHGDQVDVQTTSQRAGALAGSAGRHQRLGNLPALGPRQARAAQASGGHR